MSEIYVRKTGNSCTLYTDSYGRSIPFSDHENPPEFYDLIQSMSHDQLISAFPKGTKFKFVEPPPQKENSGPRLDAATLRSHMQALGIPEKEIVELTAAPVGTSKLVLEEPLEANKHEGSSFKDYLKENTKEDMEKVLTEFRILLAKYSANTQNPQIKQEVSAVGSFILSCWPELEPELTKMKETLTKPRFTL